MAISKFYFNSSVCIPILTTFCLEQQTQLHEHNHMNTDEVSRHVVIYQHITQHDELEAGTSAAGAGSGAGASLRGLVTSSTFI